MLKCQLCRVISQSSLTRNPGFRITNGTPSPSKATLPRAKKHIFKIHQILKYKILHEMIRAHICCYRRCLPASEIVLRGQLAQPTHQ